MDADVFTYGSLEFADVMEAVTGRRFRACAAILPGHKRRLLRDRVYPGIVPMPGEQTEGTLYRGIDAESLVLLDAFESDLYERQTVRVTVAADTHASAQAWVLCGSHVDQLSTMGWDRDRFLREHYTDFLAACQRFHRERVWIEPS